MTATDVRPESDTYRELLLGAGSRLAKIGVPTGCPRDWQSLTTLDINADHKPDVVWDLNSHPWPFKADVFDEVHAYEVMEHLGRQGDYRAFFADFAEVWRVLKPGGYFIGSSPHPESVWAWGDPGHTRIIGPECLVFLHQPAYTAQIGKTPMTDYRFCYQADFDVLSSEREDGDIHVYCLRAVKPSRITT